METWQKVGACVLVALALVGGFTSRAYFNKSEALSLHLEFMRTELHQTKQEFTDYKNDIKASTKSAKHKKTNADGSSEEWEDVTTLFEQNEKQINSLAIELDSEIDKRIQAESRIKTLESSAPKFRHWGALALYNVTTQGYKGGIGYHLDLVLLDAGVYALTNLKLEPVVAVNVRF